MFFNQKRFWSFLIFGFITTFFLAIFVIFAGRCINYLSVSQTGFFHMALYNCLLVFTGFFYLVCFFILTVFLVYGFYSELRYSTSSFYAGVSFWVILGLSIIYLLPGLFYVNNFMVLTHVYASHWGEISALVPDLSLTDFLVSIMDNGKDDSGKPPFQVPPMNGHLVVMGTHEEKPYVCADVAEALNRSVQWDVSKNVLQGSWKLMNISDISCIGLEKSQYPSSNTKK